MEFELTYSAEQESFRKEVRAWFEDNVPPDINIRPTDQEESRRLYLTRRQFGRQLGERGWLYPASPKEYGGGGLDFDSVIILEEESDRLGLSLPPYYDAGGKYGSASIRVWGTEEQKQRYLRPIYTGEVRTWQLLSEPSAGSDLAGVSTSAVRDGDHFVVNGSKIFVGSDHGVEWLWTIVRTGDASARHHNLSWLMIDADLPGITIQPQHLLSVHGEGEADSGNKNTVYFADVRVPAEALVGGENNGWKVASTHLEHEHGGAGGVRRDRIWDRLLDYCAQTERDGRPLLADPAIREGLVDIHIKLESVRLLAMRNFWMAYSGAKTTYEGSQQSYVRKTTGLWLSQAIQELLGNYALTSDARWGALDGFAEGQQRRGIVGMHPGGTTDVQRVIIARRLGIGKRVPERAGAL